MAIRKYLQKICRQKDVYYVQLNMYEWRNAAKIYIYIYIYIYISLVYIYIYINIYQKKKKKYIYIYIYTNIFGSKEN